ncbi:MAG: ankyrin repeat domain-containing protein [Gemmatimonadales bacterium]
MSRTLPERANLEYLTKEAKALLKDAKAGQAEALDRVRTFGPPGAWRSPQLADCQHALAREYGFPSWPRLKAQVEANAATDPMDALAAALKTREAAEVARVLRRFPALRERLDDPLPGGDFGATALIVAVGQSNREMVDLLLDAGANPNQRSHWWAGGFHVLEDDHGLADVLIERGAVLDAKAAAGLGRLDDLKRLVAADPSAVRQRGGDGQTPLHVARNIEIAKFLLEHGAEIDARDVDHESTPAEHLVRSHPDVARYLVSRGAHADILLAAALGDRERVRQHLETDPSAIGMMVSGHHLPMRNPRAGGHIYTWTLGTGKSVHAVAREFGHEEVLRLLLEHTPANLRLAVTCELGDEEGLNALLAARDNRPYEIPPGERLRLPFLAERGQREAVRLMLKAGWPPDATARHGATALHWAAFHGDTALARVILPHQPPLEARDREFKATPLGWALYGSLNGWRKDVGDYAGVVELLLSTGAAPPPQGTEVTASTPVLQVLRKRGLL